MNAPDAAGVYEHVRAELTAFATRVTARPEIAAELAQEAALRLITRAAELPADPVQIRAWLFRVVSNLAVDYLRRHSTWRETVMVDVRARAESDSAFVRESASLRGSPELQSIAREHLAVCFSCTLRNVGAERSAALLLREVHGFSTEETAEMLDATPVQVKNWIQQARRHMQERYAETCALVNKRGACHQCTELDGFFNGGSRDPLDGSNHDVDARLRVLREDRTAALNCWHQRMLAFIDEALS